MENSEMKSGREKERIKEENRLFEATLKYEKEIFVKLI
jgi:hypothetical protein